MALSIKTDEADRLARALIALTGETITDAVTVALRTRLEAEQARRTGDVDLATRVEAICAPMREHYDCGPLRASEWAAILNEAQP